MVFIAAAAEPTMFLFILEQDVNDMRGGRTKFVDERVTKGHLFNKVVLALAKNQAEVEDMVRRSGHKLPAVLEGPQPRVPVEGRCKGCQGVMDEILLLDGMCMVCWREKAHHYEALCKQQWEDK